MKKQILLLILGLLYWACDIPFIPKFDWGQTPETTYWAHIQVLDFPSNQPIESAICVIPNHLEPLHYPIYNYTDSDGFISLSYKERSIEKEQVYHFKFFSPGHTAKYVEVVFREYNPDPVQIVYLIPKIVNI